MPQRGYRGRKMSHGVVETKNFKLKSRFYALPLSGMGMVLGSEWLMLLSTYASNLREQFMIFKWKDKLTNCIDLNLQYVPK